MVYNWCTNTSILCNSLSDVHHCDWFWHCSTCHLSGWVNPQIFFVYLFFKQLNFINDNNSLYWLEHRKNITILIILGKSRCTLSDQTLQIYIFVQRKPWDFVYKSSITFTWAMYIIGASNMGLFYFIFGFLLMLFYLVFIWSLWVGIFQSCITYY